MSQWIFHPLSFTITHKPVEVSFSQGYIDQRVEFNSMYISVSWLYDRRCNDKSIFSFSSNDAVIPKTIVGFLRHGTLFRNFDC
jgi:hypothetical protein